jgi:hypothetical protein
MGRFCLSREMTGERKCKDVLRVSESANKECGMEKVSEGSRDPS